LFPTRATALEKAEIAGAVLKWFHGVWASGEVVHPLRWLVSKQCWLHRVGCGCELAMAQREIIALAQNYIGAILLHYTTPLPGTTPTAQEAESNTPSDSGAGQSSGQGMAPTFPTNAPGTHFPEGWLRTRGNSTLLSERHEPSEELQNLRSLVEEGILSLEEFQKIAHPLPASYVLPSPREPAGQEENLRALVAEGALSPDFFQLISGKRYISVSRPPSYPSYKPGLQTSSIGQSHGNDGTASRGKRSRRSTLIAAHLFAPNAVPDHCLPAPARVQAVLDAGGHFALTCMLLYTVRHHRKRRLEAATTVSSDSFKEVSVTTGDSDSFTACMLGLVQNSALPPLLRAMALQCIQLMLGLHTQGLCAEFGCERMTGSTLRRNRNSADGSWSHQSWTHVMQSVEEGSLKMQAVRFKDAQKELSNACLAIMIHQMTMLTPALGNAGSPTGDWLLLSSACACWSEICNAVVVDTIDGNTGRPVPQNTDGVGILVGGAVDLGHPQDTNTHIHARLREEAARRLLGSMQHSGQLRRLCKQLDSSPNFHSNKDEIRACGLDWSIAQYRNKSAHADVPKVDVSGIRACHQLLQKICLGEGWIAVRSFGNAHVIYSSFRGDVRKTLPSVYTAVWELPMVPAWCEDDPWIPKSFPSLYPSQYGESLHSLLYECSVESQI